jgi:hypothetical protein
MLAFTMSGALDARSLSTAAVTDEMIEQVLLQSYGSADAQGQLEQITIGVGGIQPMATGSAGSRPALPEIDHEQFSAGLEPGVLDTLRAYQLEQGGEDAEAAAAAAAAEEEDELAMGEGRGKRKRVSRFVKVDGYDVLKLNDYTLEDGEPSVYGTELSAPKAKKPSGRL